MIQGGYPFVCVMSIADEQRGESEVRFFKS